LVSSMSLEMWHSVNARFQEVTKTLLVTQIKNIDTRYLIDTQEVKAIKKLLVMMFKKPDNVVISFETEKDAKYAQELLYGNVNGRNMKFADFLATLRDLRGEFVATFFRALTYFMNLNLNGAPMKRDLMNSVYDSKLDPNVKLAVLAVLYTIGYLSDLPDSLL
jgi:hypothetical protein